jgi:hypothetical protein
MDFGILQGMKLEIVHNLLLIGQHFQEVQMILKRELIS